MTDRQQTARSPTNQQTDREGHREVSFPNYRVQNVKQNHELVSGSLQGAVEDTIYLITSGTDANEMRAYLPYLLGIFFKGNLMKIQ